MDRYQKRKGQFKDAGPFEGGVVTYVDPASIPFGLFSTLQNFRRFHPGMRKRKGMSRLQTVDGSPYNPVVLYPAFDTDLQNSSGYIVRDSGDAVWSNCREAISGSGYDDDVTSNNDMCCAENDDGDYIVGRTLLFFNSSRIFTTGTITSARLALTMSDTNSTSAICVTRGEVGIEFNIDDGISASNFDSIVDWPSTPYLDAGPTNTASEDTEIYLDFTEDGLAYLNSKMGPYDDGNNIELFVMNYTYDFLDVAPAFDHRDRAEFYIPNRNYPWNPSDLSTWPRLELTFDYGVEPITVYQFRKNLVEEKHTYLQLPNGEIAELQEDPPGQPAVSTSNPTGQLDGHYNGYGAPEYAPEWGVFDDNPEPVLEDATDNADRIIPASWSIIGDLLLYSDNTSNHRIYPGESGRIIGAWVNKTATAEQGVDVWEDLLEDDLQFAGMTGVASTHEGLIIQTPIKANKFNFELRTVESNNLTIDMEYLDGQTWKNVLTAETTDGTASGGFTMKQDGTISMAVEVGQDPGYLYGTTGYFYRFRPSSGTFASLNVDKVTYGSDLWFEMDNLWDGIPRDAVEVRHYVDAEDAHYTYPAGSVNLSDLIHTDDKVIVGTARDTRGIYVNVGSTPNAAATTTITDVEYWDGEQFQSVTGYTDGTSAFRNSGWLRFTISGDEAEAHVYEDSLYSAYWWRITFGVANFTDNVRAAITYHPIYDIADLGTYGLANGVWKDRALWVFDKNPNYLYVSATDRPNVLNGTDSALLRAGDGRTNRIKAIRKFHNELMVWQEERGPEGGTLTLFEGYSPSTFGRLVLSYTVGTFSNKSVVVIDGSFGATRSDDYVQTLAFFISNFGVYLTDGRIVKRISGPIQNYFDARFTENLRKGYEDKHWIAHDKTANVLRLGLVTGTTAVRPNVFPVYDLASGDWSFDDYVDDSKAPSHFLTIENDTGNNLFIEIQPTQGDGGVYLANTGLNDGGDAIEADMVIEFNSDGHLMEFREAVVRFMANTVDDSLLFNVYRNGNEVTDEAETVTMEPLETGEPMKRHRFIKGVYQDSNISLRLRNTEVDVDLYLYDSIFDVDILDKR